MTNILNQLVLIIFLIEIQNFLEQMLFSNNQLRNVQNESIVSKNSPKKQFPAFKEGYSLVFDSQVLLDMKYVDYDRNVKHLGSSQKVNVKIFTFGYKPNISQIRIQIDSEGDPFFNTLYESDQNIFKILREEQQLGFEFQQLPTIIIKSLNKIQESKGKVNASLLIYSDGKCKLTINQTSEYKNIQIISLDMNQQNEDKVQEKIAIKYEALRNRIKKTEQRLRKINDIIRQKNPSLLLQICKSTQQQKQ